MVVLFSILLIAVIVNFFVGVAIALIRLDASGDYVEERGWAYPAHELSFLGFVRLCSVWWKWAYR